MIYPDSEVVTTTYNSMGLPSTLRSSQVGILVNGNSNGGASYDEAGRLTMMNFPAGGGISHINTYAPWSQQDSNGGMLTGIQVKASNGVDQLNLQYNYDSFGNVAAQTDAGSVTNFSYDAQNRLLNAYDQSYSYDAAGRLTSFEDKTLAPNVTHPHAMQKANALGILSLTGNVLFRDTERGSPQYLTWDEENHLRTVTVNNNPLESYGYDAAGSRVKKSKGTVATYTVNPYYETTGPDLPAAGSSAATLAAAVAEPNTAPSQPKPAGHDQQLFLPLVAQHGLATAEVTQTVVYYRGDTGETCTPSHDAQCVAWVISEAPTTTVAMPDFDLTKLHMHTAPTDNLRLTAAQTMTEGQQLWQRTDALLPGDQIAPPGSWDPNAETAIKAAAMLTLTNPGFQTPDSTNTNALTWRTVRSDPSGYPATAPWWQNWGASAGHTTPSDGSNPHYAYSIGNLAYGWLESGYILGLQAGQQYDLAVDLRGALDAANAQGTWLVRAAFYNSSLQPVGAPSVAVQGGAASVDRFTWQRVNGRVTVPVGATKVKLQLVSQLNGGWLAFDNVAFTLVGASVNLAPSPGFEDPAAGQTLGWSEVRSSAHPGTGFYRSQWSAPGAEQFASKAYLISNLTGGWLESADMPVTPGQSYSFTIYYRGEVDHAQNELGAYGFDQCGFWVRYYNSAGEPLEGEGYSDCNTQRVWRSYSMPTTPPPGAAKARIWLEGYGLAGWVAFDDIEFKASNSNTNLVTNGNFENGASGWTTKWLVTASNAKAYPATGFTRDSTGIGAGRNGSTGYALSNLATGYVESSPIAVTPGHTYEIEAWLRGQLNDLAGQGEWRIRAQFYSATNVDLGYQNGCYGFGENTLTWEQVQCYVIPPQNAATMRVQLWLVQHSGWVAFDDLTVDDLTVPDPTSTAAPRVRQGAGATNSYYFNGQRIAVRQGRALAYLHTDALGSTKLVTDQDGNVIQGATRYYAYGREQTPGHLAGLPTDYTFTGQRQDNTGLIYMNARYYDPEVGQFISPDTEISDPLNLFDYNRYMFVHGNPLKYTDPSGHRLYFAAGAGHDPGNTGYVQMMLSIFAQAGIQTPVDIEAHGSKWLDAMYTVGDDSRYPAGEQTVYTIPPSAEGMLPIYEVSARPTDWRVSAAEGKMNANLKASPLENGEQLNLIGYSTGSVIMAQSALQMANAGTKIDNLILVGTSILNTSELYQALASNQNIRNIIRVDISGDDTTTVNESVLNLISTALSFGDKGDDHPHFKYAFGPNAPQYTKELALQLMQQGVK